MVTSPEPTCTVVHSADAYEGKQGLMYRAGISAESVGAHALCMTLLDLPPGARARAHIHEHHETSIYVISGSGEMLYGAGLSERLTFRSGDFIYIPAGAPHVPINTSDSEHCVAVIARTDPNEQESVVLLPELDNIASASESGSAG
jgi:uncharacterized RmlC-like cupin family protein